MSDVKKIIREFSVLTFILVLGVLLLFSTGLPGNADARTTAHSLCSLGHASDVLIKWDCRRLLKGETLESLFGDRWKDIARFNRIDRRHVYPGIYLKIPKQIDDIRDYTPMPRRYEKTGSEAKFILIDLSEQFLGAYEYGQLKFSTPVATGSKDNMTPVGEFRINAYNRKHKSSLYSMEKTDKLYPMTYALRFYIDKDGVGYWIHGRDLPGYPASHGCVGLYDEGMQHEYYKYPNKPELDDARILFEWVTSSLPDDGGYHTLEDGPRVLIVGKEPGTRPRSR
jgi:hypothetical protein